MKAHLLFLISSLSARPRWTGHRRFRAHVPVDLERFSLKRDHFFLQAARNRAVGRHDPHPGFINVDRFSFRNFHDRQHAGHHFLLVVLEPVESLERSAQKSRTKSGVGQSLFGGDRAGGDELQIIAVEKQLVESVLLGDDAVHLIDHRRIDRARHERRQAVRRRLDGTQHNILLRIDAALGQKVAGHLIQSGAETRHRDLFAALEILHRPDFFAGEEPVQRLGVEDHDDLERHSSENRAGALAEDLTESETAADKALYARQHAGLDGAHVEPFLPVEAFLVGESIKQGIAADAGGDVQIDFVQRLRRAHQREAKKSKPLNRAETSSDKRDFGLIIMGFLESIFLLCSQRDAQRGL